MPIQPGRPLLSYAKVQTFVGMILRNRSEQALRKRVRSLAYLDVGCGWNVHEHMLNCDFQWHPGVELCWDIAGKPLPFRDARFKGIYTEHCLEHHSPVVVERILRECYRLIAPGGVLRLILPDAERYLRSYIDILDDVKAAAYPYPEDVCRGALSSPLLGVNRIFYQDRESPHGHCFMFDEHLLHGFLEQAGFVEISRKGFRSGRDPALLLDSESRWVESFAMEAVRP